ncbi:helix-turn-helix transcriptional regulator [uncultured Bacteroides sp.]|jgi:transcriptional regulator with XRE-family HTH domain|uniref:helix-turn-helix domain-containing protein n=1 Tax=uncultured Bacteroides sp. TaxID=162156 RepID=UPI002586AD4D|nr:helix-turn-helix transcriptional regulator [uncultured Bacteroides sp.]
MGKETKIKSDSKISLADNLRILRESRGFTQAYMIKEMQLRGCSTSKQTYSKYEKGQAHISASELVAIAEILSICIEDLFIMK